MKLIPNEKTWVGFATTVPANLGAPTAAQLTAAIELTEPLISLTASSQGNTVPTPSLRRLFETSINGTSSASFTADFYRDDDAAKDIAWTTLPRGTDGVFYISRFGGTGTGRKPIAGDEIEVWPVSVTSRSSAALTSNTAQMFTVTCSVPDEPDEDAVVAV